MAGTILNSSYVFYYNIYAAVVKFTDPVSIARNELIMTESRLLAYSSCAVSRDDPSDQMSDVSFFRRPSTFMSVFHLGFVDNSFMF